MAQNDSIIALDVSKDRLDGFDDETGDVFQIENSPAGYVALRQRCRKRTVQIVMEASGGYERPVAQTMVKAEIPVRIVDPRKVRYYAKASGRWAKNDRLDARMIAAYAKAIKGEDHKPDKDREALAELTTYRRQLLEDRTTITNQARRLENAELRRHGQATIEIHRPSDRPGR
ncbi:MAG: transposase [Azospirillaceae bacterium]|nr:transposase [Azospirillaceae bacterium]